jgi:hypothetical protein
MTECPDCGGTFRPGEPACPHCGLELFDDGELANEGDDEEPDEGGYCISGCPDDICRNSGHCAWSASSPEDTAREIGAQRATELFTASGDPNWLGV